MIALHPRLSLTFVYTYGMLVFVLTSCTHIRDVITLLSDLASLGAQAYNYTFECPESDAEVGGSESIAF